MTFGLPITELVAASGKAEVARTNVTAPTDAASEEAELPPLPAPPLSAPEGAGEMTHDMVAPNEATLADAAAAPETAWTGEGSAELDPILAAWADVLPPSSGGVQTPPPEDGEGSPERETKPRASQDDPLDFPEPGD